jgi:hypothetical protein
MALLAVRGTPGKRNLFSIQPANAESSSSGDVCEGAAVVLLAVVEPQRRLSVGTCVLCNNEIIALRDSFSL